jgi:amino acid transporter
VTNVTATGTESASGSIEQFGYRQELKRSLSLFDLVVYGVVAINPISPMSIFGFVYNTSKGMVPLVYAVGLIAMTFTALSYVMMSRAFPLAGSVYTYAGRGMNESAGFVAGWAILLDYMLMPALVYVTLSVAIQAIIPTVPREVWIILFLSFVTTINYLGIEATARMNKVLLAIILAFFALYMILAVVGVANGVNGARLSTTPLFNPAMFTPSIIFGALSLAVLNFLGFDAISTLSEEARGGARAVGRATLLSLCVGALIFMILTYVTSLLVLDRTSFAPGQETDGAIYTIAFMIGGSWFMLLASFKTFFTGTAVSLAAQVATARLLFSMARDGKLPRRLAHVSARHKVPVNAVTFVALVNLVIALALANQFELLTAMVNFGALVGFLMLHLSVIVHFVWRQKSRAWAKHLFVPLIGFVIIAYVLVNMALPAKIAGIAWLAVGIVALIGFRLSGERATLPA